MRIVNDLNILAPPIKGPLNGPMPHTTPTNKNRKMKHEITSTTYTEQYNELHKKNADYGASSITLFKEVSLIIEFIKPKTILDYGCGKGALINKIAQKYPSITCHKYDPSINGIETITITEADLVINTDVLEHIPEELIDGVLEKISTLSQNVFFNLHHGLANTILPNGENAHCTVKPPDWYHQKMNKYFNTITPSSGAKKSTLS
jgi:O-methyltransferase domain